MYATSDGKMIDVECTKKERLSDSGGSSNSLKEQITSNKPKPILFLWRKTKEAKLIICEPFPAYQIPNYLTDRARNRRSTAKHPDQL